MTYLHFNMLLLKPGGHAYCARINKIFTFQYASIKTEKHDTTFVVFVKFTFQYASIKTYGRHNLRKEERKIYISICFY